MNRFDNLEFGDEPRAARPETARNEGQLLAEAHELYQNGRYELALHAYTRVLDANPAHHEAWAAQVRMLVELDELREAGQWANRGIARNPLHPELLAVKAVVAARMADLSGALALADAAMAERGATPQVWLARGEVLLARGEARAAFCFNQAFTLGSGDWACLWQSARIHFFHRRFADAMDYAQQATERAPDRAVTWLDAARCQLALGKAEAAETSLAHVRLLDPTCPGLNDAVRQASDLRPAGPLRRRIAVLFR